MKISAKILTATLLLIFLLTAPSTADIISLKLRSNNRHKILFSEFEFSHDGQVSIVISSVTATSTSFPDPSRTGFVLQSHDIRNQHPFEFQQNTMCPLDFKLNTVLFTFQNLSHDPDQSPFNKSYPVIYPGMYSLFFVNCNNESLVTMDGRAELYNMDDGTSKNYLSRGLSKLPFLYFLHSFMYFCFLGFWIFACFKNRLSFHKVHLLMGVFLLVNFVQLICAASEIYSGKVTGTPHGWQFVFYTMQLIRTVFLFTIIVLINTGCCFWKPNLYGIEKLMLLIVVLLQVGVNVFSILAWEAGPPFEENRIDWTGNSLAIDSICCMVIYIPMACSYFSLKVNRETYGNAAMNHAENLRLFGVAVFAYMFFTRAFAPYTFIPWVNYGVEEISLLFLCMVMFYMYRPNDKDHDDKMIEMAA